MLKSFFSAISEKKQDFTFNLANALYLQEGFTVKEQYLHGNKEFFQSVIKLVDFQDAKACAETINTWIESKTDGKVSHFHKNHYFPLYSWFLISWSKAELNIFLLNYGSEGPNLLGFPLIQINTKLWHQEKLKSICFIFWETAVCNILNGGILIIIFI